MERRNVFFLSGRAPRKSWVTGGRRSDLFKVNGPRGRAHPRRRVGGAIKWIRWLLSLGPLQSGHSALRVERADPPVARELLLGRPRKPAKNRDEKRTPRCPETRPGRRFQSAPPEDRNDRTPRIWGGASLSSSVSKTPNLNGRRGPIPIFSDPNDSLDSRLYSHGPTSHVSQVNE